MRKILSRAGQLGILSGVFWLGSQLSEWSGLPIPGSVLGVMILFFLLLAGVIKLEYVEEVANYLLKHLVFFFIPIAAALMNVPDVFLDNGWILIIAIIGGAIVPLLVSGILSQMIRRRVGGCRPS